MEYVQPDTLEAAVNRLGRGACTILAGGTDFAVVSRAEGHRADCLVDLTRISQLRGIEVGEEGLHIGPCTTIAEIAASDDVPRCLSQGAAAIGSPQIRNAATIGGNICNASPCGDTLSPLVALSAAFVLVSPRGSRAVDAADFFLGPKKTVLAHDELLADIIIRKEFLGGSSAFKMLGKRRGQVISQVNAALWLDLKEGVVREVQAAFGSVAPVPLRAGKTEAFLKGKELDADTIHECLSYVKRDISPISDVRATQDYRYRLAEFIFHDVLRQAAEFACCQE